MKKTLATLAMAGMLALTGCGAPKDSGNWGIVRISDTETGQQIRCVVNSYSSQSGITCDWDGAK